MKTVFTGFGVILAISASRSFAPGSVCFASTTITLFFAMIIVLLPPAPPRPTQTSGFNIFMVSFGAGCCAHADTAKILPANRAIAEQKTLFFVIRIFPFGYRTLLPGLCKTQIGRLELKGTYPGPMLHLFFAVISVFAAQ